MFECMPGKVWGTPPPTPGKCMSPRLLHPCISVRPPLTSLHSPLHHLSRTPFDDFFVGAFLHARCTSFAHSRPLHTFLSSFLFSTGCTRLGGEGVVPGVYPDPLISHLVLVFPLINSFSSLLFITGCYARYIYLNFWPLSQFSHPFNVLLL